MAAPTHQPDRQVNAALFRLLASATACQKELAR